MAKRGCEGEQRQNNEVRRQNLKSVCGLAEFPSVPPQHLTVSGHGCTQRLGLQSRQSVSLNLERLFHAMTRGKDAGPLTKSRRHHTRGRGASFRSHFPRLRDESQRWTCASRRMRSYRCSSRQPTSPGPEPISIQSGNSRRHSRTKRVREKILTTDLWIET
jgi:hypothetical protein